MINHKTMIVLGLFLLALAIAVFLPLFLSKPKPLPVPISCHDLLAELTRAYKTVQLDLLSERTAVPLDAYTELRSAWLDFQSSWEADNCPFLDYSPAASREAYAINESLRRVEEAMLEKRPALAAERFSEAVPRIRALRQAAGFFDIETDILALYPALARIMDSSDKAGAAAGLDELKLLFAELKRHEIDPDFPSLLAEMEIEIASLDKLLYGPDHLAAQKRLQDKYSALYYRY